MDNINKSKQGYMQNSLAEICQFVVAFVIHNITIAASDSETVKWSSEKRQKPNVRNEDEK